jgi:hypothetical protein
MALLFGPPDFIEGVLGNRRTNPATLQKSLPALWDPVVVQNFDRQSPTVAVGRGTQAKAKDQLPHPAAQPGRLLAVAFDFPKELVSQRLARISIIHKPLPSDS